MKKTYLFILITCFALLSRNAGAQTLQSAYFLDNYSYSYRLNPAMASERNFIGFGIGNITLAPQGNVGLGNFLFKNPTGSGLVTGLNSAIGLDEFLGGLKKKNSLELGLNENIVAIGKWSHESFSSFEINLRGNINAVLPKDMFSFLKNGSNTNDSYDFSNLNASVRAFVEIAYGYTRPINKNLSVGGRVKAIVGIGSAEVSAEKMRVSANATKWEVEADAQIAAAASYLTVGTMDSNDGSSHNLLDFSSIEFNTNNIKPTGFGLGIDLGVVYRTPIEGLTVSASLLDLGFIQWKNNIVGIAQAASTYTGATEIDMTGNDAGEAISEELENALDNLTSITEFHKQKNVLKTSSALPFSLNAGARYELPFSNMVSVGALLTVRSSEAIKYADFRLGATITPVDWFSLTGNIGATSLGMAGGAALSFNLGPLALFAGLDTGLGGISPQYIPIDAFRYCASCGINLQFGSRHK